MVFYYAHKWADYCYTMDQPSTLTTLVIASYLHTTHTIPQVYISHLLIILTSTCEDECFHRIPT
jgi:hypothetical protein